MRKIPRQVRNGRGPHLIAFHPRLSTSASAEYRPEADDDESCAGDQLECGRFHEAFDLRADQDADGRGQDEGRGAGGEDHPLVVLPLGGEEHRGELRLVANLGEEDGDEDGGEGFDHDGSLCRGWGCRR